MIMEHSEDVVTLLGGAVKVPHETDKNAVRAYIDLHSTFHHRKRDDSSRILALINACARIELGEDQTQHFHEGTPIKNDWVLVFLVGHNGEVLGVYFYKFEH